MVRLKSGDSHVDRSSRFDIKSVVDEVENARRAKLSLELGDRGRLSGVGAIGAIGTVIRTSASRTAIGAARSRCS